MRAESENCDGWCMLFRYVVFSFRVEKIERRRGRRFFSRHLLMFRRIVFLISPPSQSAAQFDRTNSDHATGYEKFRNSTTWGYLGR